MLLYAENHLTELIELIKFKLQILFVPCALPGLIISLEKELVPLIEELRQVVETA